MNTVESGSSLHLPTVSRAVLSLAIGVAHTVERAIGGDARTRAAQANATAAVLADQDRARQREEIRRAVAALAVERATPPGTPQPPTTSRDTVAGTGSGRVDRRRARTGAPQPVS